MKKMLFLYYEYTLFWEPVFGQKHKTFYPCFLLCCCESDPLDINVCAPVGAYTPGQTINLYIKANNKSDQPVSGFSVQLIKVSIR